MRAGCVVALLIHCASAQTSGCVTGSDGANTCHADTPLADAMSLLQQRNLKKSERDDEDESMQNEETGENQGDDTDDEGGEEEEEEEEEEQENDDSGDPDADQVSARALLSARSDEKYDYCKGKRYTWARKINEKCKEYTGWAGSRWNSKYDHNGDRKYCKTGYKKCMSHRYVQCCGKAPSPDRCEMSTWSDWGDCSASCGPGATRSRTRTVVSGTCAQKTEESEDCNLPPCPVDCTFLEWESQKDCTATCRTAGMETFTRNISSKAQHGGKCEDTKESRKCTKDCIQSIKTVRVKVKNAVDQEPVDGAKVRVASVDKDHTATTGKKGEFEFDVQLYGDEPEKVTLTATKEGFIDEEHTEEVTLNTKEIVMEMSPKLEPGQLRFVMVWGPQPNDLDAITKFGTGADCSVDYNVKKKLKECSNGVSGKLDWDHCWLWPNENKGACPDASEGLQPETTTISAAGCSGDCKVSYKVHNYSREKHPGKEKATLEESKAVVKVYSGTKVVATFRAGQHGKIDDNYWYVFSVDLKKGSDPDITECSGKEQCGW